jgi:serine/threonine protein phosphatase PrpC
MVEPRPSRTSLAIQAAGVTDVGRRRDLNEDAALVREDLRLFLVADGAGGHGAGDVASALALTAVARHFEATEAGYHEQFDTDRFGLPTGARRLALAVRKANREIIAAAKASQKYGSMGSTIVGVTAAAHAPVLYVAHVGDSRCYRLRGGHIESLTQDHSLFQDVLELHPDIADDALARLPRKVVTRALGMEDTVRVSIRSVEIVSGDVYLLCSDGLTASLPDDQLRRILALPLPPKQIVERLIQSANVASGEDNISAVVLTCEITTGSSSPEIEVARDNSMASAPEILVLGIESEPDIEDTARIHVVSSESVSSGLIDALGDVLRTRKAVTVRCGTCGKTVVAEAVFCPYCGARRPGMR